MEKQLQSNEQGLETENNAVNQIRHVLERFEDRLTLDNPRLAERYLKGDLKLLICFGNRVQGQDEFVAYLERAFSDRRPQGHFIDSVSSGFGNPFRVEQVAELGDNRINNGTPEDGWQIVMGERRSDCYYESVLVGVVQFMEYPERVSPSLVRFGRSDSILRRLRHALYFSWRVGSVFRGVIGDGEVRGLENSFVGDFIGKDEMIGQVVKGGSQVEQNITDNERDTARRLGDTGHKILNSLRCLRVGLDCDGIRLSTEKELDFPLQVEDVLFGPFEFRPNASKSFVSG